MIPLIVLTNTLVIGCPCRTSSESSQIETNLEKGAGTARQIKQKQFSGERAFGTTPNLSVASSGCQTASFHSYHGYKAFSFQGYFGAMQKGREQVTMPPNSMLLLRFSCFSQFDVPWIVVNFWLFSRVLKKFIFDYFFFISILTAFMKEWFFFLYPYFIIS